MGWMFDFDDANLVNYLTTEVAHLRYSKDAQFGAAPRISFGRLTSFLERLSPSSREHLIVSINPAWLAEIGRAVEVSTKILRSIREKEDRADEEVLDAEVVEQVLRPLNRLFTGYAVYGLVVPEKTWEPSPEKEFFFEAAHSSQEQGLFLMPDAPAGLLNILDPFPALRALVKMPVAPPAVVFWTSLGGACALSLERAKEFFRNKILDHLRFGNHAIDQLVRQKAAEARTKNLLHISDLHFGDPTSDGSRRYIKSHFDLILEDIDRVVVTGDLFNTPDAKLRDQFLDFRSDVERMTAKPLIVIPGNHDVRPKGNKVPGLLRQNYEFVIDIGWQPLVIDDDLECVFFCFNSVEEGELARGCVTDGQRMRLAALFNEERARRKRQKKNDLDNYTKIAVVHHHPFPYETAPTARYDAFLRRVTGNEDLFTRFDQADKFVSWCAERNVSLILHGHKHVPYHVQADIQVAGRQHTLVSIGCGSTTGAENSPLSYDVVSLNPRTGRWGVSFYADASRSGAGFNEVELITDTRRASSAW